MKKLPIPAKKKRPNESIMRAHSVMQDVIGLSNRTIKAPAKKKK
jgi:hypothetical protein